MTRRSAKVAKRSRADSASASRWRARLYGDPFLVVLDEPNSNLDTEGEIALRQAITNLKERGAIVVLIAHRPSALAICDHILVLANGEQKDFGSRDEIMRKITAPGCGAGGGRPAISRSSAAPTAGG